MNIRLQKSIFIGCVVVFGGIISCEKDFTDIGSNIIKNSNFSIGELVVDIKVGNSPIEKFRADNISGERGQYLLGVHNRPTYEKIEASIISQVGFASYKLVAKTYSGDTTVVSTIDTAFIKLPYQATLVSNTADGPIYTLDAIIGDTTKPFTLNTYQLETYLSRLNQSDPTKLNSYLSNDSFLKGSNLSTTANFQFTPNIKDTIVYIKRRLGNNNKLYAKDTVKYAATTTNIVPLPFALIPLNKSLIKKIFLDELKKLSSSNFASQDAFNDYFKGIILEASGNEGSLLSLNFNNSVATLNPSIEIYYTNTILDAGVVVDTIKRDHSYNLSGIRINSFKMEDKVYPDNNEVILQGTAGSEAVIDLFGADLNGNGIADKLEELRKRNLLINNASITFYINQSADTTAVPTRLYLYKEDVGTKSTPVFTHVKDSYPEGLTFGGYLARKNSKVDSYTFNITDYISDLIAGETNSSPPLKLKVYNVSDAVGQDINFVNNNWNPKAITLLNHLKINGERKAELKISYSIREK